MRSPSLYDHNPPPPPAGGLFAVRYIDVRGQTVTTLFRRRGAAEKFAARVEARGGSAAIYSTTIGRWVR